MPIKTLVGPTGRTPIKAVTGRTNTTPIKTLVGSTGRPPIKTIVGRGSTRPIKTLVGRASAPPLKTTPANLGTGGRGTQPFRLDSPPTGTTNPSLGMRSLGTRDGNPGRSVGSVPRKASGAPNPVLDFAQSSGESSIQAGGMGQTRAAMARVPRKRMRPRGAFFGQ